MFVPHYGNYRSLENFKGLGWGLWNSMFAFFVHFCPPFWDDSHVKFWFSKGSWVNLSTVGLCDLTKFTFQGSLFHSFSFERKHASQSRPTNTATNALFFFWWGGGEQLEFAEWSEGFSLCMPFGFNHLVEWWLVGTEFGFGPSGGWQKHVALALRRFLVSFFQKELDLIHETSGNSFASL